METQIGSETMRYTVWTVKNLNQIPIEYGTEYESDLDWQFWHKADVIFLFLWTQTKEIFLLFFSSLAWFFGLVQQIYFLHF